MSSVIKSFTLNDREFELMRTLIYQRCGITLPDRKRSLLLTRLNSLLKGSHYNSIQEYYDHLVEDKTGQELVKLVDAVSTNHTFFFREKAHFDFLNNVALPQMLGDLRRQNNFDFRLWCAAASTGEEPYSLAMTLREAIGTDYSRWQAGLLATDIAQSVLEKAERGIYRADQMENVSKNLRNKYFQALPDGTYQVKPTLKQDVTFRRFNLMNPKFPFKRQFHIIFCRNVMIYFDQETVEELVHKMYELTVPGGYLCVGHSESLGRIKNPYEQYVQPAVYRRLR